jgi:hypothetical protein
MTLAVSTFMVGAAKSGADFIGSSQQATAQENLYNANRTNALSAGSNEYNQIALRRIQEQDATGEKTFDNMLDTRARAAHATVAAGEAGISGLSVDSLVNDIYGAGGRTNDRIKENSEMSLQQLNTEELGVTARTNDRINSVKHGVQPSLLGLAINLGSTGLNAATGYKKMTG